jgi:hypothetical protein
VRRLNLFTGGQRIKQLVELKAADATRDTITLYDSKGSRHHGRQRLTRGGRSPSS